MYAILLPTKAPPKFEWNDLVPGCIEKVTNPDGTISEIARISCIPAVFKNLIFALVLFAGIVAIILIIQAGAKFVLSSGDPKKVEEARNTLVYVLLGIIIIAAAYLLVSLVSFFTGVKCIKFFGFECL